MESTRAPGLATTLAVVAIVLLLPIVALASRPENAGTVRLLSDDPIRIAFDVLTYLLLIAALLGLVIVVWALWPRPEEEMLPPVARRRRRPLATAITMAAAVLLAVWLRTHGFSRLPTLRNAGLGAPGAPGGVSSALPQAARAAHGTDWLALAIAVALAAAAVFAAWRALRTRPPRRRGTALAGLEALLDDAIDDVLAEGDPRRAVIAAWARLERVLARHGLPRRPAEAPFEFAYRARNQLGLEPVALDRIADLYEWARFSVNEVTPAMREDALRRLMDVRDGLRLAA